MRNVVQPTELGFTPPFILGMQLMEPGFGEFHGFALAVGSDRGEVKVEELLRLKVVGRTVASFRASCLRFFLHRAIILSKYFDVSEDNVV